MERDIPRAARTTGARRRDGGRKAIFGALAIVGLTLTACARDIHDLEAYVADVKLRKPPGIEPLPEIKPYEKFEYEAQDLRNPFDPSVIAQQPASAGGQAADSGVLPDPNRTPEFLESFPLDTLRMVGTLEQSGQLWALIKTPDATVQRVAQGNYIGQNNGKITLISDASITLMEIVPDGFGGWREREGLVALSE
jgi:type IV pilus assembly protein PilP